MMGHSQREADLRTSLPASVPMVAWFRRAWAVVIGVGLCFGPIGLAWGDAVKLGNIWIDGVDIQNIADDRVYYYNDVGLEFDQPLDRLTRIKVDRYPQLARFDQAISQDDNVGALDALVEAQSVIRELWLQQWVRYELVGVYDQSSLPIKAVETYLQLLYESPVEHYQTRWPRVSLPQAGESVKQDIRTRLEAAALDFQGTTKAQAIQDMLQALSRGVSGTTGSSATGSSPVDRQPVDPASGRTPDQPGPTSSKPIADAGSIPDSGLTLPKVLDLSDPITKLLLYRNFQDALGTVDRKLATEQRQMAMRLFQRGVAQMGLATLNGDDKGFMDAGLSFMRVAAYFPRSGFAGPSLVEAGVVHEKIGRPDIALRLYERARPLIDPEVDANYAARLQQMIQQVEP